MAGYLDRLGNDQDELDRLAEDLLIHVTSFFRDRSVFEYLAESVIPDLVRRIEAGRGLRVWVPGCSTGEEAYSLVMLFLEEIAAAKKNIKLQVFASDIDRDAVALAREGLYPEVDCRRGFGGASCPVFLEGRRRLQGFSGNAVRRCLYRSERAGRPAVLADRPCLLPQPSDLSRAGSTGAGNFPAAFFASRGRDPASRQFGDARGYRQPLQGGLQSQPRLPAHRTRSSGCQCPCRGCRRNPDPRARRGNPAVVAGVGSGRTLQDAGH